MAPISRALKRMKKFVEQVSNVTSFHSMLDPALGHRGRRSKDPSALKLDLSKVPLFKAWSAFHTSPAAKGDAFLIPLYSCHSTSFYSESSSTKGQSVPCNCGPWVPTGYDVRSWLTWALFRTNRLNLEQTWNPQQAGHAVRQTLASERGVWYPLIHFAILIIIIPNPTFPYLHDFPTLP